jgi:hypothetical protein
MVVFLVWFVRELWATVRSYRRERQWDALAKAGDPTPEKF